MRGIPGVKIDTSQDTVRTGEGHLVPGWEMGILGACEGEKRMILIGPDMAFGDTGVYQVLPPKVSARLGDNQKFGCCVCRSPWHWRWR
jgi:FKBP-type peptidyl-prolyl cis-trans isomerase